MTWYDDIADLFVGPEKISGKTVQRVCEALRRYKHTCAIEDKHTEERIKLADKILEELRNGTRKSANSKRGFDEVRKEVRRTHAHDEAEDVIANEVAGDQTGYLNTIALVQETPLEVLHEIPNGEVGLYFSSYPYYCQKNYGRGEDADNITYDEQLAFFRDLAVEQFRTLRPGGRCVINMDSVTSRPQEGNFDERTLHYKRPIVADITNLPISSQTNRPISTETAKGMLAAVKTMYRWAYKMRLIDSLPRNIDDITKTPNGSSNQPKIKIFTLDELNTLLKNAVPHTKNFIVLALNCSMGQRDISNLRVNEIDWKNGYIERDRSKTGVRAKYKLWGITLKLLKEHRQEGSECDGRVFLTQKKKETDIPQPLLRENIKENGKLTKSDAIKNAFWRLLRKTDINGGRSFYSLRKTGATLIEEIDPLATEMYLSHSERGMKRNYAKRDWGRLARALKKMEKKLKL